MKKNRLYFGLGLAGILVLATVVAAQSRQDSSAAADEQVVLVSGYGAIIGGDEAKARDDALANALRNAVEQVAGTLVESEVLVKNYQTMEDRVYSQTTGYVRSYKILKQHRKDATLFETTISAVVRRGRLKDDLKALGLIMRRKGKPRLMVLIDEKNMDTHYFYTNYDLNTTRTTLQQTLMEKGFNFVDPAVIRNALKRDAASAAVEGNEAAARKIALERGAEVLILGKAIAQANTGRPGVMRRTGFYSCMATINLRAVRADDGRILASTSQQAVAAHINPIAGGTRALKKAAVLAADDLANRIAAVWQQDIYSGTTIKLRILNVVSYAELTQLKRRLEAQIRGIQKIFQREFSGQTALWEINLKGSASQFAEELATKDFTPIKIKVMEVSQNTVQAKLIHQ